MDQERRQILVIIGIVIGFIALFAVTALGTLKISSMQSTTQILQNTCNIITPIYTNEDYSIPEETQTKFLSLFQDKEVAEEFLNKIGISSEFELMNESEMPAVIYDDKTPWIIESDYFAVPIYNQVFERKSYVILLYNDSTITSVYDGTWSELVSERG